MAGGSGAEVRVSDAERTRVVDVLRTSCVDGRLTLDEFGDRVERALAARTRQDLEVVVADLPVPVAGATRPRITRRVVAFMGGNKRRGRWRVGRRLRAVAVMGGCVVDLREAELDGPTLDIVAVAVWGGVHVVVPEGIPVELDGFSLFGGKDVRVADVPLLPGAPVVRVHAFPVMGGVHVRTRGDRRARREHVHGRHRSRQPRLLDQPVVASLPAELRGTVTLLFTDIEGFSRLCERLGDDEAQAVLREHHALLGRAVRACGGYVVKTQGDGAMVAFPGASQALRCAIEVQRAIEGWNDGRPDRSVRVRMGLHTGEVVRDGDDFGGRAVIQAARIASIADGGEILVSELVRDLVSSPVGNGAGFAFGEPQDVELKGLSGLHRVRRVDW